MNTQKVNPFASYFEQHKNLTQHKSIQSEGKHPKFIRQQSMESFILLKVVWTFIVGLVVVLLIPFSFIYNAGEEALEKWRNG